MKIKCLNCGREFEGSISYDELGWHSYCEECDSSFDVDVPEGRIIMAFTDYVDDEENPYKYFTDDFIPDCIFEYFAFDTVEEFIEKWEEISDNPLGMWYWVLDDGHLVCSGGFDLYDIELFKEHWGLDDEE